MITKNTNKKYKNCSDLILSWNELETLKQDLPIYKNAYSKNQIIKFN